MVHVLNMQDFARRRNLMPMGIKYSRGDGIIYFDHESELRSRLDSLLRPLHMYNWMYGTRKAVAVHDFNMHNVLHYNASYAFKPCISGCTRRKEGISRDNHDMYILYIVIAFLF